MSMGVNQQAYRGNLPCRQSPTQSNIDYRKSPSSGIYSGTSAGSPSPITVTQNPVTSAMAKPVALPVWNARQTKSQHPIIMHSVKSTQVQKPILQTAVAPTAPTTCSPVMPSTPPLDPPSYNSSIR